MSTDVVQQDFGGFDPRFPGGIGITLGSIEAYDLFSRFIYTDHDAPSTSATLVEIALKSVLDHEVRHYHDSLLSPWGNTIFRKRGQAFVNGVQAIRGARELAGDTFPLPISDWLRFDEQQRRQHVSEWQDDLGESVDPLHLPSGLDLGPIGRLGGATVDTSGLDAQPQFIAHTRAALAAYDIIRKRLDGDPPDGSGPELRPCMIFEVSALATQIVAIRASQGVLEALKFFSFLMESERPYAELWRLFTNLALELERTDHPDESYDALIFVAQNHVLRMAMWALMGNQDHDGAAACPTRRFVALAAHLRENVGVAQNRAPDVADAWDEWDVATGARPWRESCVKSLKASRAMLRQYEALPEVWKDSPDIPRLLVRVIRRRVSDQEVMTRRLLDDPNTLVDAGAYLSSERGTYPQPSLRVVFDGFAALGPDPEPPGYRGVRIVDSGGGPARISGFALSPDGLAGEEALDDVLVFERLMCACDLAFARHSMPWEVFERSRDVIGSTSHKRVLLIV